MLGSFRPCLFQSNAVLLAISINAYVNRKSLVNSGMKLVAFVVLGACGRKICLCWFSFKILCFQKTTTTENQMSNLCMAPNKNVCVTFLVWKGTCSVGHSSQNVLAQNASCKPLQCITRTFRTDICCCTRKPCLRIRRALQKYAVRADPAWQARRLLCQDSLWPTICGWGGHYQDCGIFLQAHVGFFLS